MNGLVAGRCLITAVTLWAVAPRARADYTVTDLGALPGGSTSHGVAVNAGGLVTGYGDPGSLASHAFVSAPSRGPLTDLGTLGGASSHGAAINASGVVVGDSDVAGGHTHAFAGTSAQDLHDLGLLRGWTDAFGTGVNDQSQVVGYGLLPGNTSHPAAFQHAFLGTTSGGLTELGTLGGADSQAFGINNSGVVVGASTTASGHTHAFVSGSGGLRDLGGLGTSNTSYGLAINGLGVVVGYGGPVDAYHAFRTRADGSLQDLKTLSGSGTSFAYAVDTAGDVVGASSATGSGMHAFFVSAGSTRLDDLNALLLNGSGWVLNSADGINDSGQIVGTGLFQGSPHAFILTPAAVPEPTGLVLTGLGAAGLAAARFGRGLRRGRTGGRGAGGPAGASPAR